MPVWPPIVATVQVSASLHWVCTWTWARTLPVIISAGAVVLLLVVGLWIRARRSLVRRLLTVAARLDDQAVSVDGRGGKEAALDRLERSAERAQLLVDESKGDSIRLSASFNHMADGVVVVDQRGEIVLRNGVAEQLTGPGGATP